MRAAEYGLDRVYGDISARTMFEEHLKTPKQWFPELRDLCRELGLDFAATIHGPHGLTWALRIGLDVVKIASMDHTNLPFLRSLVNVVQAPILISFGMAREADVAAAVQALEGHRPGVGLFHCSAVYPPKPEEIRLANIGYLRGRFQVPVGFSDHTVDTEAALAARAGGAMFFEKHVTLDHTHPGPDHPFAMEMEPLKEYMSKLKAAPLGQPGHPVRSSIRPSVSSGTASRTSRALSAVVISPRASCSRRMTSIWPAQAPGFRPAISRRRSDARCCGRSPPRRRSSGRIWEADARPHPRWDAIYRPRLGRSLGRPGERGDQ